MMPIFELVHADLDYRSEEYRALGIGGLMGDVVSRMTSNIEGEGNDGALAIGGKDGSLGTGRGGEKSIKLALSGCHDTTLAAVLASLGAFENEKWPPYTSHIAIEMFKKQASQTQTADKVLATTTQKGWWASIFGGSAAVKANAGIARRKINELNETERARLEDYYVRVRYNDKVMKLPGCKPTGKHLEGDDSFCTL
jgi:acid phosphatase